MPYTDLTAAAAAHHQCDLLAGAAVARRHRPDAAALCGRNHHLRPLTAWRAWLQAGRL